MSKEFNIEALVEASDMEKKIADKVINAFKGMSKDEQAKFMKSYLKNPDAAVGYMFSNMQKMAMKEEKELDAVNPKALKGKFKDREDKDIDNDGDVDSSDEYLHKRRAAVSKAIKNVKEAKLTPDQMRKALDDDKAKAKSKDKVSLKKAPWEKNEEVELDEAKLSASQRDRLDDLILNVHMTTHPEYDGGEEPTKYLNMIRKEFGDKVAKQVSDGIEKVHWGRDNESGGVDKLSWRKGNARITKSGKMNAQDVKALKNRIKQDKAWGGITKKVKLPEEVELDEALASNVVRGDNYVGVPDRVVAQAKEKVKKMNTSTASDHSKAMQKALSDMGWEMTVGGKYVRESVVSKVLDRMSEAKSGGYTINHKTFSSAVQHAEDVVNKRGFEIDPEEWDRKVSMGPRKPGAGKTNSYTIDLMKNGKDVKQKLQMQVYYDEGRYELNMYIS